MKPTKPIRSAAIDALMTAPQPPAISLYLPTIKAGREVQQNAIRFGNLVRDAEKQLAEMGLDPDARSQLLAPLEVMRADAAVWRQQDHGLAVFRDAQRTLTFPLPVPVEDSAHVGDRFAIRPLLPLVHFDGRFHVLAFGRETVRLFAGTRYELRPVLLPEDTPESLGDVVGHRLSGPHVQHHSGNGPGRTAVFHGQGAGADKEDGELRKYAARVAHTLPAAMDPEAPVVLAGTENTVGAFRSVCTWRTLCADWIHGAPADLDAEALHEKAWAIVEPTIRARRMKHLDDLAGLESAGRATHTLDDALDAARAGRVEAVYFTEDAPRDAAHEDLAREAWRHGGRVFEVEAPALPDAQSFAAVLRY